MTCHQSVKRQEPFHHPSRRSLAPHAMRGLLTLLCLALCTACAMGQDLYELLGVSASASPAQMKRA